MFGYSSEKVYLCGDYWSEKVWYEKKIYEEMLDFIIQKEARIIPIEVKSEENVKAKSLSHFVSSNPGIKGIRLSMSDYRDQSWMENIPLYALLYGV